MTNTSGEVIDIGYLPWSHGGPAIWPWLNTRFGLSFTHFDKINGASTNYDGAGRNAKDDNTTFLYYAWTACLMGAIRDLTLLVLPVAVAAIVFSGRRSCG